MIIELPIPDRNPGPYERKRPCADCGAFLLTTNPGPYCAPCELAAMPACEVIDLYPEDEVA
jgi:hypothetical protein